MREVQNVTFLEYLKELATQQKVDKKRDTTEYVRAYMQRIRLATGVYMVSFVKEMADKWKVSNLEAMHRIAFDEFKCRLEDDFMEYVAEYGINVYKAQKADLEEAEDSQNVFDTFSSWEPPVTFLIDDLRDVIDLEIVLSTNKYQRYVTIPNPFSDINELPFKFVASDKTIKVLNNPSDWDNLTDDEWNDAKLAELNAKLAKDDEKERKYHLALNVCEDDEYKDFVTD